MVNADLLIPTNTSVSKNNFGLNCVARRYNQSGNKPYHCTVCSKKLCPEKKGDETLLCSHCSKFPCSKLKSLDKRYIQKYGISPINNLKKAKEMGIESFIESEKRKWTCPHCGKYLCIHSETCINCEK